MMENTQVPLVLLGEGRSARGTLSPGHPTVAWLAAEMQAVLSAGVRIFLSGAAFICSICLYVCAEWRYLAFVLASC